jgi:3-oxoacyl-[acyl-carrier-protein] synthase III
MFVVGVGTAFPESSISDGELAEIGVTLGAGDREFLARVGVASRAVSVPVDHIKQTGNGDIFAAWNVAQATPTSLGVAAVKASLAQVGIGIESIGLVLADTATPYQTCPSEAQRIAGEFGLKVPAYDIVGGVGAIASFLSTLSAWKPERLPDYILCVSTNTPSQQVRYREDGVCGALLGDAAVALVLSPRDARGGRVASTSLLSERGYRTPVVIAEKACFHLDRVLSTDAVKRYLESEIRSLLEVTPGLLRDGVFVPPQLYATEAAKVLGQHGIEPHRVVTTVRERGFSLGSSSGVALASVWPALSTGSPIVVLHCGDGLCGSVVVERA